MSSLALDGVRIVDFSWQIAGPTCTRYLGAMGAEVIRIESNRRPDPYRARTISYLINQSKKSITLNLSNPKGIELVKDLAKILNVAEKNKRSLPGKYKHLPRVSFNLLHLQATASDVDKLLGME